MTFCDRCNKEAFYLGDIVKYSGKEWIIVGLSCMKKLDDGEPEWEISWEVQEVALAKPLASVSYQKPLWVDALSVQPTK